MVYFRPYPVSELNVDSRDANWQWFDQPANRYTHLCFDISEDPTVGATIGSLETSLLIWAGGCR